MGTAIVSTVGVLVGVVLGGWLQGRRSAADLDARAKEERRQFVTSQRREAYLALLEANAKAHEAGAALSQRPADSEARAAWMGALSVLNSSAWGARLVCSDEMIDVIGRVVLSMSGPPRPDELAAGEWLHHVNRAINHQQGIVLVELARAEIHGREGPNLVGEPMGTEPQP